MAKSKDKILRKNLAKPGIQMLSKLLSREVAKAEAVPPVLIQTMLERNPDTLLLITFSNEKQIILHWEFQATNDRKMVLRNAVYDYLIYGQYSLPVITIVLYIGSRPLKMKTGSPFLVIFILVK